VDIDRGLTQLKVLSIQTVRYGSLSLPLDSLPSSLQLLNCKLEGFGGDWAAGQCPTRTAAALPNLEGLASLEVTLDVSALSMYLPYAHAQENANGFLIVLVLWLRHVVVPCRFVLIKALQTAPWPSQN
jgi:hypothetical protein